MTFNYPPDKDLASLGISEFQLVPVYYSTLVGNWILADSYIVDTENNKIKLQVSHFTKFGTAAIEEEKKVYMPFMFR